MAHRNAATPQDLVRLYQALSPPDRQCFLKAACPTAETVFEIIHGLPPREQRSIWDTLLDQMIEKVLPQLLDHALSVVVATPAADRDVLRARLRERARREAEVLAIALEEEFKAKRERKPRRENIERALKILRLRDEDPNTWSNRALAKEFNLLESHIRQIRAEAPKWRYFARTLLGDGSAPDAVSAPRSGRSPKPRPRRVGRSRSGK